MLLVSSLDKQAIFVLIKAAQGFEVRCAYARRNHKPAEAAPVPQQLAAKAEAGQKEPFGDNHELNFFQ